MKFRKEKKLKFNKYPPWNNEPAPFGSLSAIFWGKIFFGTKNFSFFEGEKIVFLKKNEKKIFGKISEKKFFFRFFQYYSPIFWLKSNFFRQNLSYNIKLLLGLILVQFEKIWWNRFFANSKKLWFWAKMTIFRHIWPKSAKMRFFIKNRAVLFFYPYCPPTSCQVSKKSLERFPRSIRYIHPNIHTCEHPEIRTRVIS